MFRISSILTVIFCVFIAACSYLEPAAPADDQTLDGPIAGLTQEQLRRFNAGDQAFNNEIFTSATGLGPLFVSNSCGSCHAADGKGHPFSTLTRFGQKDANGNQFLHLGGPQLQHRALPGYAPEQLPAGATFSNILPPANSGLGYIMTIPDDTLISWSDPNDLDNDGISGRVNRVKIPWYVIPHPNASEENGTYIGRLGKKSGVYNLLQQTANAYNQDMGITSTYEPKDVYTHLDMDPEVSNKTIADVVFYLETLKAPTPRKKNDPTVKIGNTIFNTIGCQKCHIPTTTTGSSPIAVLAYRTIWPYSDFLLHDMGTLLDDGYTEGSATSAEWRTPALWGLGLSKASQGGQYFLLHDGRAKSIEEAIIWHGGEGEVSKNKYKQLTAQEKAALLQFLESL
jgi:CxxC motif-containing protein (DUF1111 family)